MKIGDIVTLGSGGPPLTITATAGGENDAQRRWVCHWLDDDGKLDSSSWPEVCLKVYVADDNIWDDEHCGWFTRAEIAAS